MSLRPGLSRRDICNIVKLKGITTMWQKLGRGGETKLPRDVPPGHLAVIVGDAKKRFVIRADYLNHPAFRQLLDQAYEEYGFNSSGPLTIPCNEHLFQDVIHSISGGANMIQCSCIVAEEKLRLNSWKDSSALLQGFARGSTC